MQRKLLVLGATALLTVGACDQAEPGDGSDNFRFGDWPTFPLPVPELTTGGLGTGLDGGGFEDGGFLEPVNLDDGGETGDSHGGLEGGGFEEGGFLEPVEYEEDDDEGGETGTSTGTGGEEGEGGGNGVIGPVQLLPPCNVALNTTVYGHGEWVDHYPKRGIFTAYDDAIANWPDQYEAWVDSITCPAACPDKDDDGEAPGMEWTNYWDANLPSGPPHCRPTGEMHPTYHDPLYLCVYHAAGAASITCR